MTKVSDSKTSFSLDYQQWYAALKTIAKNNEQDWLISSTSENHFGSYQKGLSPEEELSELNDISEWRGCGCGGG